MEHSSRSVQLAIEQIHDMKMQPISPERIADALGMERIYLSKRFHVETGRAILDYIHSVKMEMAENLISRRNYTLTKIADLLGYSNYAHFSRVFAGITERFLQNGRNKISPKMS